MFNKIGDTDSQRTVNCRAGTECSSATAVNLKCREPGYLGCYCELQRTNVDNPLQSFARHVVGTDRECASLCKEQRQGRDVAVIHQRKCLCVQSVIFLTSLESYLHECSCPEEMVVGPDVFYAFNVSYGFCDHLGFVENGTWDSNSTWFGSIVTLTCEQGFIVNGSATVQCVGLPGQSTYFPAWNSSIPTCKAVTSSGMFCKHPGNLSNGEWNSSETSLGSSITLTCDDNYVINGSATLRCVRSSDNNSLAWDASFPTCLNSEIMSKANKSTCDHPGNVSHGTWNLNTTLLGSIVTLECDEGYIINGSSTLLCVGSTQLPVWNASTPSCQIVKRMAVVDVRPLQS
ncbi:C4b-binding protein beta chain-like [Diadema setosum]|uniref:C4b-binding protein beta chain-like n=1 Tax=Diadema setosum TaxID=31175 RepID=UPI003B3A67D4